MVEGDAGCVIYPHIAGVGPAVMVRDLRDEGLALGGSR